MFRVLLTILVPAIVAKPDIISLVDQFERETSFLLCQTYPNLTIHEEAMVKVDDRFRDRVWSMVDLYSSVLLSLPKRQSVHTEQVSISCLDHVLFGIVSKDSAQLGKIG